LAVKRGGENTTLYFLKENGGGGEAGKMKTLHLPEEKGTGRPKKGRGKEPFPKHCGGLDLL